MASVAHFISAAVDALYPRFARRFISPSVFRYGVCGGANMVLDTVWYFVIYHYIVAERFVNLGFAVISPHIFALMIVFPITFFTGFWLNRNVAFRESGLRTRTQLVRYAASVVGAVLLNYMCMKLLVEQMSVWPTPAKSITTIISVAYSYLAARYYTFRR